MLGPEWTSGGQSGQGLCPRGAYGPDSGDWKFTSLHAMSVRMGSQ